MGDFHSSHQLYLVLNENGSQYCTKNRDFRLYKTKEGLKQRKEDYQGKRIAVFTLTEIKPIEELLKE